MSSPMHVIAAAVFGLSVSLAAYAADVAPKDNTPAPVQPAPRDTTRARNLRSRRQYPITVPTRR